MNKIEEFKEHYKKMASISHAISLIHWDLETKAPKNSVENRSKTLSILSEQVFNMSISKEVENFIDYYTNSKKHERLSDDDKIIYKLIKKNYEKNKRIPSSLVAKISETTSKAHPKWVEARSKSDFNIFKPSLEELKSLSQEMADYIGYKDNIYDVFIDEYEPGMKTSDIQQMTEVLKEDLIPLIDEIINSKDKPDKNILKGEFDIKKQKELSYKALNLMKYDFESGRLDKAAHPFTIRVSPGDVRITTRYRDDDFTDSLFSTIHECGHALYELGLPKKYQDLPIDSSCSFSVHESQSRFWENIIGRNYYFWKYFYNDFRKLFPIYEKVSLEDFYKAINYVDRTPIRVDADEVTYNLHIMLRYEIEENLLNDRIEIKDLPEIWNYKMKEYIGYEPKNNAEGILQDVHWSHGSFGYFPSYMIGNLIASQLHNQLIKDIGNFDELLIQGDIEPILDWMRNNIHIKGKKQEPQELVKEITGDNINSKYFMDYLKEKYSKIYNI